MQIDTSTPFGQRVERRLREERIAWLTTVRSNGTPEPSPIWFWWDGQEFLIYSQPNTQKLRNIVRNPRVAINFDGDGRGGDIVVLTGEARLTPDAPPANEVPEYTAKYGQGFERIGMTSEKFAQTYSVAVRVRPTAVRGH